MRCRTVAGRDEPALTADGQTRLRRQESVEAQPLHGWIMQPYSASSSLKPSTSARVSASPRVAHAIFNRPVSKFHGVRQRTDRLALPI